MYLRDNASGTYLPLVTEANMAPGTMFGGKIHFVSATPDLSHVVIASQVALTGPESGAGAVRVGGGRAAVRQRAAQRRPRLGTVELGYRTLAAHAISADGSRVIWTTPEDELARVGHLYMRDTASGRNCPARRGAGCRRTAQAARAVPDGEQRRLAGVLHRQAAADSGLHRRTRLAASRTCTSATSSTKPASSLPAD